MKLLVATQLTQGQRMSDFNWCEPGEFLCFPMSVCTHGSVDDNCGCMRSMTGLSTHKATTTGQVAEFPMSREEWVESSTASFIDAGFSENMKPAIEADLHRWIDEIQRYDVGDVLEFRDFELRQRRLG